MTAFQRNENRALGVTHIMVIFMKYLDRIPTRNPSTTQFCVRFENKKNQKKPFGQRKSRNVLAKFKWSIGAVRDRSSSLHFSTEKLFYLCGLADTTTTRNNADFATVTRIFF